MTEKNLLRNPDSPDSPLEAVWRVSVLWVILVALGNTCHSPSWSWWWQWWLSMLPNQSSKLAYIKSVSILGLSYVSQGLHEWCRYSVS